MRAIVQRVTSGAVQIDDDYITSIGKGMVVHVGVSKDDSSQDADKLANKIAHLRIFEDQAGVMNRSVLEIKGQILVVSQFTLLGDVRKGHRPSYADAAEPESANNLYERFIDGLRRAGIDVRTGVFQAMMSVHIVNDGPVTILLDTHKCF